MYQTQKIMERSENPSILILSRLLKAKGTEMNNKTKMFFVSVAGRRDTSISNRGFPEFERCDGLYWKQNSNWEK